MSKLFEKYKRLKKEDSETLYLFKVGIFYIFIDEDAKTISPVLSIKLTKLNEDIVKCGFPANSLEKYINFLKYTNFKIKIIDETSDNNHEKSKLKDNVYNLLTIIDNTNIDKLSNTEIINFCTKIKEQAHNILRSNFNETNE